MKTEEQQASAFAGFVTNACIALHNVGLQSQNESFQQAAHASIVVEPTTHVEGEYTGYRASSPDPVLDSHLPDGVYWFRRQTAKKWIRWALQRRREALEGLKS